MPMQLWIAVDRSHWHFWTQKVTRSHMLGKRRRACQEDRNANINEAVEDGSTKRKGSLISHKECKWVELQDKNIKWSQLQPCYKGADKDKGGKFHSSEERDKNSKNIVQNAWRGGNISYDICWGNWRNNKKQRALFPESDMQLPIKESIYSQQQGIKGRFYQQLSAQWDISEGLLFAGEQLSWRVSL